MNGTEERTKIRSFEELLVRAKQNGPIQVVLAGAQDEEALRAIKAAYDAGLAEATLVGDSELIKPLLPTVGLPADTRIVHETDVAQAAVKAAGIVKETPAGILMKGLVNSSDFLRAVQKHEC